MTDAERLESYLNDFGERLERAAHAPTGTHRRPRMAVLALCAGAIVAIVVAVSLGATSKRLDPVAEARAALGSPGEIVYMKITSQITPQTTDNGLPSPQTTEQWSAVSPLRWRQVQAIAPPSRGQGAMGDAHGPIFGRMELSYAHGVQRLYRAERDTLTVTSGYRDDESAARIPSVLGQGAGDPQGDLRSMLDADVSDEGEQQVGGRTVRRFVSARPRGAVRLVLDVDPVTFAPLEATISHSFPDDGRRILTHVNVDDYKRMPLTASTERLLEIQTTPQTQVNQDSAAELRERVRRWKAKCRPLKNGNLACPPPDPQPKAP